MDDLGPVLSLVLGYRKSSVVGPVYDRDRQGFQQATRKHPPIFREGVGTSLEFTRSEERREF